jgi:hypothetical protein
LIFGVFISFGGPQAHAHSLAVAVRKEAAERCSGI